MSVAPKFGGGGVKCVRCEKTVYQSERIDYDNHPYHTDCFKCLECKNVVNLTSVAMIEGKLFCKTCFKKIFTREGKYSSFSEKGGDRSRANTADQSNPAPVLSPAGGPPHAERRASLILQCVVADCKNPRVARKQYCLEHLNSAVAEVPGMSELVDAIDKKDVAKVKDILSGEKNTELLFKLTPKGVTPIEHAFTGIQNSRACGEAMLNWLQSKVSALEKGPERVEEP